jgi:hypothetical protein
MRRSRRRDCRSARRRTAGQGVRPGRGPGRRAAARRPTAGADSGSGAPTGRPGPASRGRWRWRRGFRRSPAGVATFSSAVMLGSRWNDWNTRAARPRRRRARPSSFSFARSWPNRRTVPAVGSSSPAPTAISDDLPDPDGPTMATRSPGATRQVDAAQDVHGTGGGRKGEGDGVENQRRGGRGVVGHVASCRAGHCSAGSQTT